MRLIVHYLRPYFKRMSFGLAIKLFGTVMDLLLPLILAHVIDVVAPTKNMKLVLLWGGLMVICSVVALLCNVIANRKASAVARDTVTSLRHDLFEKISFLSNRQVDQFTIPSLIARMSTDSYYVYRMVGMMQRIGVRAPILVLGGILVTYTLDAVLATVLLCMLPLMAVVVVYISRRSVPQFGQLQRSVDHMVRVVRENAEGVRVIKALSRTEAEKDRFETINRQIMRDENRANSTMAITKPAMNLMLNTGLVMVVVVGAYRVNAGATGVGTITAFLTYFTIILNAMLSINRVVTMYAKALASAQRIQRVMDAQTELQEIEMPAGDPEKHLEFDHVTFSYNGSKEHLSDIHFSLKRGERLGIIGPTGSGKSTIASLMMRFYDVNSGAVRIGGQDVRSMEKEALRQRFGVVFQHDTLFRDTIGGNIKLGREIDLAQVDAAIRDAQAAEFIDNAGGLDAWVESRGANYSGGQKQRLLISRALAGHPEILILDDSSSALDYRTDAALRGKLAEHYGDTTTVVIAQRVSSVMHCDKILVLEEGKMLGFGTHAELMETCGIYREIAETQMGEVQA